MKDLSYANHCLSNPGLSGVIHLGHCAWVLVDRNGGLGLLLLVWPEFTKVLGTWLGWNHVQIRAWTLAVIRECLADFSINCMWRHLPLISNVFERICAFFVQFSTKISHELLKFCAKKGGKTRKCKAKKKEKSTNKTKANSTQCSQAVSHPSTN